MALNTTPSEAFRQARVWRRAGEFQRCRHWSAVRRWLTWLVGGSDYERAISSGKCRHGACVFRAAGAVIGKTATPMTWLLQL